MSRLFLSYARSSEDAVAALVRDLEALGHEVWWDRELSGGQVWWDRILAEIRTVDGFLFVLDPASVRSVACQRELGYAEALGVPVVPVRLSRDVSLTVLPARIARVNAVDYTAPDREAAFRLARAVRELPPRPALPDPLPAPPDVPLSYLSSLNERVTGEDELGRAEQSALLLDLKAALAEPEDRAHATRMLEALRRRKDLFAVVSDEIDRLLADKEASPAPRTRAAPEVAPGPAQATPRSGVAAAMPPFLAAAAPGSDRLRMLRHAGTGAGIGFLHVLAWIAIWGDTMDGPAFLWVVGGGAVFGLVARNGALALGLGALVALGLPGLAEPLWLNIDPYDPEFTPWLFPPLALAAAWIARRVRPAS